jgi:hypothetical protein
MLGWMLTRYRVAEELFERVMPMTDNAGVTAEHCVLGRKMGVALKLRNFSPTTRHGEQALGRLSRAFDISGVANSRTLNLFKRSVKYGGNGSQPPSHEATPKALASARRAKEDRRKKQEADLDQSVGSALFGKTQRAFRLLCVR